MKWAARRGMLAVAERCLSLGADVNGGGRNFDRSDWGPRWIDASERPLHCAVNGGHEDMVRLLIKNGADVDLARSYQRTPLFDSATFKNEALVRVLVDAGSRADAPQATIAAVADGEFSAARYLIEKTEGDPRAHNGRSSVSVGTDEAVYGVIVDVLRTLLSLGSDIECRDCAGRTPLSHAAEDGAYDSVKVLLKEGADVETTDNEGRAPMSYAMERGDRRIIQLISGYLGGHGAVVGVSHR